MAKGSLEVIVGCISSGKTEELIRRLKRATIARQKVARFKPQRDTRNEGIASRNGDSLPAVDIDDPNEILQQVDRSVHVVAIDEAQFFDERLFAVIEGLISMGIRVVAAGLNTDFRAKPFGIVPHLMAVADRTSLLNAVCMRCGKVAIRSQLLVAGPSSESAPILVGGDESYEARCRDCHVIPD